MQEVAMQPSGRVIRRLPFSLLPLIVIFNFFPQNVLTELKAWIHCQIHGQNLKSPVLSSFQCKAATSS
jgi:hypothetical protein